MAFETLVGLRIADEGLYQAYRDAMRPILERHGGSFRYDFRIREVLRSEASHDIDRLFVIVFKDRDSKKGFFNDPEYKEVRKKYFEPAVLNSTTLAEYDRP